MSGGNTLPALIALPHTDISKKYDKYFSSDLAIPSISASLSCPQPPLIQQSAPPQPSTASTNNPNI